MKNKEIQKAIKDNFISGSYDYVLFCEIFEIGYKAAKQARSEITPQRIETFFSQPGINITGVCNEAGIARQYLNRCWKDKVLPGPKVMDKLLPVLTKYGF